MSFDAAWFDELRGLSEEKLQVTRERGIGAFVPHVGELCRDGYLTTRFVQETENFVSLMSKTPYRMDTFFRAYERHLVNFPKGRAFRKQWNIAFTAGETREEDNVRVGIGFRLCQRESEYVTGIEEYLEFREKVRLRPAAFDGVFRKLDNYYEIDGEAQSGLSSAGTPDGDLSRIVIADQPSLDCWRFYGKRLLVCKPEDLAVICSPERLRDAAVDVFGQIQSAGFGM